MRVWLRERVKVSPRTTRILGNLAALAVALFIVWLVWMVASLAQENVSQNAALDQANERLVELGEEPVPAPEPQAPIVQPPPAEVSTERIQRAVAQYLAANPPADGVDGQPGADGEDPPTAAQVVQQVTPAVREAVVEYIAANPPTNGQAGAPGSDGAPGPGPSDEQVAAAVAAFCDAHDGCRGPEGPTGADSTVPGPEGPPGPAAFPFTFTFQMPDTGPLKGQTYTCTVTDPAEPAACTSTEP